MQQSRDIVGEGVQALVVGGEPVGEVIIPHAGAVEADLEQSARGDIQTGATDFLVDRKGTAELADPFDVLSFRNLHPVIFLEQDRVIFATGMVGDLEFLDGVRDGVASQFLVDHMNGETAPADLPIQKRRDIASRFRVLLGAVECTDQIEIRDRSGGLVTGPDPLRLPVLGGKDPEFERGRSAPLGFLSGLIAETHLPLHPVA